MNRLEMSEEIAKRVPRLADWEEKTWVEAEKLRTGFVADYPPKKICDLKLDEYVIGKGAENCSFCYRIERQMDTIGIILGSTSFKFGVYFGRTKSDPSDRYRFAKRWGSNVEEAFESVKQGIVELLTADSDGDAVAIADNPLSPLFKGKILFIYNPKKYAPIYSEKHLEHFIAKLNLRGPFQCEADMQRALMEYRATWPELLVQHPALYMWLLYEIFPYSRKRKSPDENSTNEPMLDEALTGAQLIAEMPALSPEIEGGPNGNKSGKPNYEKQARRFRQIGDRGEALVFALEKERLIKAGKPKLANRVKHLSQEDDYAGYDILSFEEDGSDRPIEVKATMGKNLDRGFYISGNEIEKAAELPNYHLYIVFSAMSKQPRILPIKQPGFNGKHFQLTSVLYNATVSTHAAL
jgi:hypothetical protein